MKNLFAFFERIATRWLSALALISGLTIALSSCKNELNQEMSDTPSKPVASQPWEAQLQSKLLQNRVSIGTKLDILAAGLTGVMRDPVITQMVFNYEQARRIQFYDRFQTLKLEDEYPFMHLSTLKDLCNTQGIDLVARMKTQLLNMGYSPQTAEQVENLLTQFPVSNDYQYMLYPTIMMPYLTESRSYPGWDGHSPKYISRTQFMLTQPNIQVYSYVEGTGVATQILTDKFEVVRTPSWDIQVMFHRPFDGVQFILEDAGPPLRAISSQCGCSYSGGTTYMCNNSGGGFPGEPKGCTYSGADQNCTGECALNKDGHIVVL